ncbi:MAG TPA: hypothetical protein VGO50_00090 [Pyrinomonadaceae bacterium]|jgi:ABC-type glycerol-3-phosphate transport system substrate-binding protein|nr:hypothetical protein [Pyrinomonadaceae bacterium]
MKKIALFVLLACCFCLAGCSKDAEVNAFITEFESTTNEIAQKVDANPSAAGLDEAQKAFDAKQPGLKAKWEAIKNVPKFQVSTETQKKLDESVMKNMKALQDVFSKNAMKLGMDRDAGPKIKTLMDGFKSTLAMDTK